jgi:hypothetical protein
MRCVSPASARTAVSAGDAAVRAMSRGIETFRYTVDHKTSR